MLPPMWIQLACRNIEVKAPSYHGTWLTVEAGETQGPSSEHGLDPSCTPSLFTPLPHSRSQTTTFTAISETVTSGNVRVGTLSLIGSTRRRRSFRWRDATSPQRLRC